MKKTFTCTQCGPGCYYDPCFIEAKSAWGRRCRCCGQEYEIAKRKISAKRQREKAEVAETLRRFMEGESAA
jgi:transcription elongation factor Elf1